jgi:hypothetical protein
MKSGTWLVLDHNTSDPVTSPVIKQWLLIAANAAQDAEKSDIKPSLWPADSITLEDLQLQPAFHGVSHILLHRHPDDALVRPRYAINAFDGAKS